MGSHTQEQFSCLVISKKPSWRKTNAGRNNLPSDWRNDVKFPPPCAQWDELELPWAQHLNLPCPGGSMLIYPVNIGDPCSSQDCIHQEMQNALYREHRTPCVTRGGGLFVLWDVSEWQNQFPGEFGEQSRFPAVTFRDFVCIQQRGLRDSAQQCRVEHFLPLPASAERQELQDLDETEILILCYCIKFD